MSYFPANIFPVTLTSGTPLTLSGNSFYVHTGTQQDTWVLPVASSGTGRFYYLKNKGAATIISGNSPTETIFTTFSVLNFTMNSGEAYTLASDGSQWQVL